MRVFSLVMCILASLVLSASQSSVPLQVVYVSLVEKDTVSIFYNRLASQQHQVVLTPSPVKNPLKQVRVELKSEQTLAVVELQKAFELNDEVQSKVEFTLGSFAVVRINRKKSLKYFGHLATQPELYSELLNPVLKKVKSKWSAKNNLMREKLSSIDQIKIDDINIDQEYLQARLAEISGEADFEIDGQTKTLKERGTLAGRKLAREYLKIEYQKLGFQVSEYNYGRGVNFIAEKIGKDPSKYLILSAHFDSVRNSGADDNGAGTVSTMAIANALKDLDLNYTLRVVGFDEEEVGLVGSKRYAKKLSEEDFEGLIGVINFEMTGYDGDSDGEFHVIHCSENSSEQLSDLLVDVIDDAGIDLTQKTACTNRSDHASFWRYDQPAVVISQNFFGGDSNPCYHRSCDKLDKIDFEYMYKLTQATGLLVARLVEVQL